MKVGDLVRAKTIEGVGLIVHSHWHKHGHFWLHTVQTCCNPDEHHFRREVPESQLELISEASDLTRFGPSRDSLTFS